MDDKNEEIEIIPFHLCSDKGIELLDEEGIRQIKEEGSLNKYEIMLKALRYDGRILIEMWWYDGDGNSSDQRFFIEEIRWINKFIDKFEDKILLEKL